MSLTVGVENRPSLAQAPESGQLAWVRGRFWVVADVERDPQASLDGRPVQHLVSLVSVEDDATGEELEVVWEIEPGTSVIERAELLEIAADRLDEPAELDAFLDAVRWGAVTSADHRSLQAPFRSGIVIEDYQLEPLVRALRSPRTNLLIADDVGLGKTIEAGLVEQELLLRHRARTALVVCSASLQLQWRDEMREKFGREHEFGRGCRSLLVTAVLQIYRLLDCYSWRSSTSAWTTTPANPSTLSREREA